ncbi:hypothetical protein L6164_029082 [Bauhinia variegata]|uniref:Uncharacterized protein n=1 Tax=Bauhinia variegata TaxID=167791 RepID=A0ACB9L7P8_BAUVA|nr:hypothetical protein L6164_029082 [Bauhinia variegata]
MEEENQIQSIGNDEENQKQQKELEREEEQSLQQLRSLRLQPGEEEKLVLQFLDSMDNYLTLIHALSSTLRQGWLDLASARHSMGVSRINSSLLDLKLHSASTSLKITQNDGLQPCFELHKWVPPEDGNGRVGDDNTQPQDCTNIPKSSETAEITAAKNKPGLADVNQVQKERSKCLSVFGVFTSPKLRASQLSFEKALETLVEIANIRSSLLCSFQKLHQEVEDNDG